MRISDWSSDVCSSDLHRFTQDRRRDPELAAPPLAGRRAYLWHVSGIPYWRDRFAATGRHALGRVTEDFVPAALRPAIVREARLHLAGYALLALASLAAGSGLLLWLWVVPVLLGHPFLRLYLLAEHSGCPEVPDMLANSRPKLTNTLLREIGRQSWRERGLQDVSISGVAGP